MRDDTTDLLNGVAHALTQYEDRMEQVHPMTFDDKARMREHTQAIRDAVAALMRFHKGHSNERSAQSAV